MGRAGKDVLEVNSPDVLEVNSRLLTRKAEGTLSGSAWQGRMYVVACAGRVQRGVPSSTWGGRGELSCVGPLRSSLEFQGTIYRYAQQVQLGLFQLVRRVAA